MFIINQNLGFINNSKIKGGEYQGEVKGGSGGWI